MDLMKSANTRLARCPTAITAAALSFVSNVSDTNGSASARVDLGPTPGKFQVKVTAAFEASV
jgi:hypothetical protein